MKTIITNSIIITMNSAMEVFPDGYVKIEGTKILETGPSCESEGDNRRIKSCWLADKRRKKRNSYAWYG